MNHASVVMKNVASYRGAKCVLDIESLHIAKGELVSILGPNGSGKSTLLRVLNGLLPMQQGTAQILGVNLPSANVMQLRRRSAMVFQDPLFVHDTVYANVALPLTFRRLPEKTIKEKVEAALLAFRCGHLAGRLAHHLSGGEAQRVCLARAFVTEPELLLLDEPFSALDPATRNDLLAELKAAALARQVTVVLVSHNLDEVLQFAQRAVVMEGGRVVQDALPETVLRRPVNLTIARLAGMDNMWPCQVSVTGKQGQIRLNDQLVFAAEGVNSEGRAWCCLPGDSFKVVEDGQLPEPSWMLLDAQVIQIIPGIGVVQVQAKARELSLIMRMAGDRAARLSPGQQMTVAFPQAAVHILMA